MSPLYLLVVLGATVAAIVCSADAAALNCTGRYQAVLQQALSIKQECGNMEYEDCCQALNANEVFKSSTQNGIYEVTDVCGHNQEAFQERTASMKARCDIEGEDGGWLVILRRDNTIASSQYVNFARNWVDYVNGFGDLNTEFWYGLRNMHCLTSREEVDLRIDFKKRDGTEETYLYRTFSIGAADTNYTLTIGDVVLPPGGRDQMAFHNGYQFTTTDADHDVWPHNCASSHGRGGWWYKNCYNALFTAPHSSSTKIQWGSNNYANTVEMKVRPKTCVQPESCTNN